MFEFLKPKPKTAIPTFAPLGIDIHCHMLPGVDDGSKSNEESLACLKVMRDAGFEKVICTPHYQYPRFPNVESDIQNRYDSMLLDFTSLNAQNIPQMIGVAGEYRVDSGFSDRIKNNQFLLVGGKYLLIMGSTNGDNRLFSSVSPSIIHRPNDKWTIRAGFRITSDMGLNPQFSLSKPAKNLAPYKRNGGTGLASAHIEAYYRAGKNVWLAASIYHLGGTYAPFYGFANGEVLNVSATAISAAAAFRFNEESFLQLSFTVIRDHYGTLPYMYHDSWMHGGFGSWGMYTSPTDYYRLATPFNPYYMGGLY